MDFEFEDVFKWGIAAIVIIAVAWAPVSCSKNKSEKIQSAIESGIDPIQAKCAYGGTAGSNSGSDVICAIAAMNAGEKK